ncbi:MAG: O-antigen ligase family protein [Acidobacteriota bacterium]
MTVIAWLWLAGFLTIAGLALRRPAWAASLYFLTYFALPKFWWWGRDSELLGAWRWNLIAGVILALAIAIDLARRGAWRIALTPGRAFETLAPRGPARWILILFAAMAANAILVHLLLAPEPEIGRPALIYLIKHTGLAVLIWAALRHPGDQQRFVDSLLAGACYLGVAVVVFGEGEMINGRLEHVGPANAREANDLAALLLAILPLAWGALFHGRWPRRVFALGTLILTLRMLYLCNSRGTYVSAALAILALVAIMPRDLRKSWIAFATLCVLALGGVAVSNAVWPRIAIPLADPQLADRSELDPSGSRGDPATRRTQLPEEREPAGHTGSSTLERLGAIPGELADKTSASGKRLRFWQAGLAMLRDYPLGSGGHSFLEVRGAPYLAQVGVYVPRSVHNGYLDEALDWGLQALILRLALCAAIGLMLWRIAHSPSRATRERLDASAFGAILLGLMASSWFGDRLHLEWFYWLAGWTLAAGAPLKLGRRETAAP